MLDSPGQFIRTRDQLAQRNAYGLKILDGVGPVSIKLLYTVLYLVVSLGKLLLEIAKKVESSA